MSWIRESEPSRFHKFCCRILKAGPIPKHIAIIMDGNRRYARKQGLSSVLEGHALGFDTLSKTLEWCRDLGITEVTVYAFSIENFKRSEVEVQGLMDLAREKFQTLLSEREKIHKYGVCFRFFGDLSLLPLDIQRLIAEITLVSMQNKKHFFNVCIAYTSRNEISRAVADIVDGVQLGYLKSEDLDEELISRCLDSNCSPDPDLLIRTSGEFRFSDFLLYQCSYSCLYFDDVLWPEYNFWHLCCAILHYQRNSPTIQKIKTYHSEQLNKETEYTLNRERRVLKFLNELNERKLENLRQLCSDKDLSYAHGRS